MSQNPIFPTILLTALLLTGCGLFDKTQGPTPVTGPSEAQPAAEIGEAMASTALGARAVSAEALDSTSAEEKAAALAAPAAGGERALGKAVVALGPPAEQGLWLSTALVDTVVQGRIETAAGNSLALELRPGTGGALLSLAAFQALGLSLTDLPEVAVFAP
jgi:hypothetical protein